MNGRTVTPLPAFHSPLIGRERELDDLVRLLKGTERLVTLRGPGGIGKTALALQAARMVEAEFAGGAVMVELAAMTDPAQVLPAVASTLGIPLHGQPVLGVLAAHFKTHATLLVLDNFEQVRPAALDVQRLLEDAPELRVLITSRVALQLYLEREYPVGPLDVPTSRQALHASPAVRLLIDRIQHHNAAYTLTPTDETAALRLCQTLEGIPLALELAAAAARTFSLPDLAARLSTSVGQLKANFLDRPERLRSLQSTVEWSYALLPQALQALFTCCAVFRGGFTLEALEAVWTGEVVLDLLPRLLEQSLLQSVPGVGSRWRMLEPLRELAAQKLTDDFCEQEWRRRHAEYYVGLFERLLVRPRLHIEQAQGHREEANLNAALEWAIVHSDVDLAIRALSTMGFFYVGEGGGQRGFRQAQAVLALPGAQQHLRRMKALHIAWLCVMHHDPLAHEDILKEWVVLSRTGGDLLESLWSLNMLCCHHYVRGDTDQWKVLNQELLELLDAAERDDTRPPDTVLELQYLHAWVMNNLGFGLMERGDLLEAQRYAQEAVERFGRSGDVFGRLYDLLLLAEIEVRRGHPAQAQNYLEDVLEVIIQGRFRALEGPAAGILALLAESCGQPAAAVRFMVLADQLALNADAPMGVPTRQTYGDLASLLERVQPALSRVAIKEARAEGLQLTLKEAWEGWQQREVGQADQPHLLTETLTPREREVLALVAQGHPDRKVARLLGISPTTASKHVSNLLGKLGLHNRVELARWAIQQETDRTTES